MGPSKKPRPRAKKGTLKRLLKEVFSFYPRLLPITMFCIVLSAAVGALPAIFMRQVYEQIGLAVTNNLTWGEVIICNFCGRERVVEAMDLEGENIKASVILSNYADSGVNLAKLHLRPYEAVIYRIEICYYK